MTAYDDEFFEYVNSGAIGSAELLLPHLTNQLAVNSVLDVGCGQGAWLSVWASLGVEDLTGIDGEYVNLDKFLVSQSRFKPHDLNEEFQIGRRYDLVQSLEVAEHLPVTSSRRFVSSLVRHADLVLFSAAAKGQGGDNHINEQDYEFWRELFSEHQFVAVDYLRPLVEGESGIEPWYRYNTFLYVSEDQFERLPECIRACRVSDDERLKDISPIMYKLRKLFVRLLPIALATRLAKYKEKRVSRLRRHSNLRGKQPNE